MAFSESFGLGNSTFMDLESEVNKALQGKPKNPHSTKAAPTPNANNLDIIDESPTNSKAKPNKSRSRHQISQFGVQRRKRFQKSKSDSTLNEKSTTTARVGHSSKGDNYSEFFKSEFSIEEDRHAIKYPATLVSTSQVEAAFNCVVRQDTAGEPVNFGDSRMFSEMIGGLKSQVPAEDSSEALDVPIFSEDLQEVLSDGSMLSNQSFQLGELSANAWKESMNPSEFKVDLALNGAEKENETREETEEAEEVINIDDATFICPDEEGRDLAERTIRDIRSEVHDVLQEEHGQDRDQNCSISSMEKSIIKRGSLRVEKSPSEVESPPTTIATGPVKRDLEELKRISAWNLPQSVLKEYEKKGINKMFDWQIECLSNQKVLFEHCNLVYSAPTSAGKTLVSEILLIKTILERGKKVILILPFISVVREKMFYLQDLLTPSGYRVEGFFGGYTPPGGFDSINVAICTIEKANSIVNKLLEQGKLDEIGTVVVDEIHLISDPGRGYILELLLAKVLFMSRKFSLQIQIITMSATLANVELLKKWLDAELYITNYRPVALQEMIKIGCKIYSNCMEFIREINSQEFGAISDQDHVAQLCIETLAEGCSVVVFCPSKDWCENLSVQLAGAIHTIGRSGSEIGNKLRTHIRREAIEEVKKQLKDIPTGLDSALEKTINYACAFHHAGLTTEERDIIEACFKSGSLKIIVATSTLSSGVNLPARRVIIRTPLFGGKQMSSLTYKQMIGRAGRTGKDTLGESILICTDSNARIGKDLIRAEITPIRSCLEMESSTHLKRALLEVISSGVAKTKTDIESFVKCTLLNTQKEIIEMEKNDGKEESANQSFIFDCIDFLIEYEFIRLQRDEEKDEDNYVATRLGMACLASSMPPTDGLILFSELQKSRRCFVLESELHAVYLVTPYSVCYQMQDLDWLMYLDLWEKLSPAMKKVGELVGVKESFLVRAMRGQIKLDYKLMQIHKRFYTALALQELVNETPVNKVAAKYKCNRGMLQSLQQMASTFAGIVTAFCKSLNWSMLALIVGQFKERLFFGVHQDLIDLLRLPDLNYKRARALFDAGIVSLIDLANADVFTVEKILHNSLSFDTAKQLENEDEYEKEQRNNMRNLYITGKAGLTVKEAAKMLVEEARIFLQLEMGVNNINWNQESQQKENESGNLQLSSEIGKYKRKSNIDLSEGSPPKIRKCNQDTRQSCSSDQKSTKPNTELPASKDEKHSRRDNEMKSKISEPNTTLRQSKIPSIEHLNINKGVNSHSKKNSTDSTKSRRPSRDKKPVEIAYDSSKENKVPTKNAAITKSTDLLPTKPTQTLHHRQRQTLEPKFEVNSKGVRPPTEHVGEAGDSETKQNRMENQASSSKSHNLKSVQSRKDTLNPSSTKQSDPKRPKTRPSEACDPPQKRIMHNTPQPDPTKSSKINKETKRKTSLEKINNLASVRRSPRNHLPSSTRIERSDVSAKNPQTSPENDLFLDDTTFEMNSAITNAMDNVKEHPRKSLNKSSDEIAASQEMVFQPKTQSTRLLRSYRDRTQSSTKTPAKRTPLKRKSEKDEEPPPAPSIPPANKSNTIEVSDFSVGNSLMQNPIQLNSSHILSASDTDGLSLKTIEIKDICGDQGTFRKAVDDLMKAKTIGFSVGVEKQANKEKPLIGANLLINKESLKEKPNEPVVNFALDDASYVSGISMAINETVSMFLNLQEQKSDNKVTIEMKIEVIRKLMENPELTLQIFDSKEQLKTLRKAVTSVEKIRCKVEDPKVANWLMQPDQMLTLESMAQQFAPECKELVKLSGTAHHYGSIGLDSSSAVTGKVRSSIEACVTNQILRGQVENLKRIGSGQLYKFFIDLEMPLILSLVEMEMHGFPANEASLRELYQQMTVAMKKLETKIYEAHGSRFNLSSTSAVARVLGLHRKTNGRVSTSKQILEKVDSPIAQMIIAYRKLSFTLAKNIHLLLRSVEGDRIKGQSITFTSTGRISMQEPNLQSVAKDFEVAIGNETIKISCRSSFFPPAGRCLISADFCQLEMRILAHLSQDPPLVQVMNSEKDVFTAIAAKWNKIPEDAVSEQLRNGTKQICYGIVYGMGMRSLAESLKCTEQEATTVSEQFHAAYPGIRSYAEKVKKFARHHGYVETITGRRRYLDNINSGEPKLKNQAERQAVNSAIQGSAADIAKTAILRMQKNICKYREKMGISERCVNLVLHVHDELIFEVPEDKAKKVAKVLSITMENCVRLSVPLKVKLKIGKSWGDLREVKL